MEESILHDIMEAGRPNLKINPIPLVKDEPNATFSQILDDVLYLEDFRSYTH